MCATCPAPVILLDLTTLTISGEGTHSIDEKLIQYFGRAREDVGRWEDDIKMDLTGIDCEEVDWIHLVQRAHVNTAENLLLQ
jgi:hypothetical protein